MLTVKNVKHYESLSEETNCFTASVYYSGKHVGTAKNNGQGGMTHVWIEPQHREIVDTYCLNRPDIQFSDFSLPFSLDLEIDRLVSEFIEASHKKKFQKQLKRDLERAICVATQDGLGDGYRLHQFRVGKRVVPLKTMLSTDDGKRAVQRAVARLRGEGHKILNDNLGL